MASLKGKTLFVTGASRGIGLAIAKRAARDGANIAIVAKTSDPNPKLEGTIHTAAKEIEDAGGPALPIVGDVRGEGFFYGIELVKDKATKEVLDDELSEWLLRSFLSTELFEAGLYCRADDRGDSVIQLAPPLISDQAVFEEIEGILRTVLTTAWDHLQTLGRPWLKSLLHE